MTLEAEVFRNGIKVEVAAPWTNFAATVEHVAQTVKRALEPRLPSGFRGRIVVVVDNGVINLEDIEIIGRPKKRPK